MSITIPMWLMFVGGGLLLSVVAGPMLGLLMAFLERKRPASAADREAVAESARDWAARKSG